MTHYLTKASGQQLSWTTLELPTVLTQLTASQQAFCVGPSGTQYVLVGPSVFVIDVEWLIGRRLVEIHSLEPNPSFPYGISFEHLASHRTFYEALQASGYIGAEPSLQEAHCLVC